jgi:hypothetical protein
MDEQSSKPDILEQGGRRRLPRLPSPGWRPSRGAGVLAAVTLAMGLAAGYAAGHGQGRGSDAAAGKTAAPTGQASGSVGAVAPAASPGPGLGLALTEDPGTCSVQAGHDLELGIPITNRSPETVLLESVKPVTFGSGLLKVLSWRWDPCGFDNDAAVTDTVALGPGETTWVTAVVQPLVTCPGPAPLQFQVTYSVNSQRATFNLPGFSDLTGVHYSGCPAPDA